MNAYFFDNARFRGRRWLKAAVVLGSCLVLSACFLGYDSRWGESKRAQQRAAQDYSGRDLQAESAEKSSASSRKGQHAKRLWIRVRTTREHAAEVVDWEGRFRATLARANQVTAAECGFVLELAETGTWVPKANGDDLETLLRDLQDSDPGEGVQWVVGLLGSTPKLEVTLHKLGAASFFGKHLVLRGANDALEYDAIQQGYNELSENERSKLYQSRRTHRATVVLLHELGHSLGAIHARERTEYMYPSYSTDMRGFGDLTRRFLQLSALQRVQPEADRDDRALARTFLEELREHPTWPQQERSAWHEHLSELLRAQEAAAQSNARTSSLPVRPQQVEPAEQTSTSRLTPEHRKVLQAVLDAQQAGRYREAWQLGQALFSNYLEDYAVQEARCQIAGAMGLHWAEVRSECAPMLKLTPGLPKSFSGTP